MSSLTSTTSSAIALSEIFFGTAIVICVLILLLAVHDVMSRSDSRNTNTAAALRAIWVPLIVTFCAWLVFEAARYCVVTGPPNTERLQLTALWSPRKEAEHAKEDDVVNGLDRHDQRQISRFVEGGAQDDAGFGRKEELVDVGVARVHGAEDHARDEDSRNRTASLNELRLQEDTKEQLLNDRHKEDHHDAQLNEL